MPSSTSSTTSTILLTHKAAARPRAVVVILGHLGASEATLRRYLEWYSKDDRQCSVVTGTSPPLRFMSNASLRPPAQQVWRETIEMLHDTPASVPLVMHLFSNGGAFLLEEMEKMLEDEDNDVALSQNDKTLIRSRLQHGYQMFDCAPCYIRMMWNWSELFNSFPHPSWTNGNSNNNNSTTSSNNAASNATTTPNSYASSYSSWQQGLYTSAAACALTTWTLMTPWSLGHAHTFWQHWHKSRHCLHNIFLYTTTDLATDAHQLEKLVAHRQHELRAQCKIYKFNDSNHCRLDIDHPNEYQHAIDEALEAAVQRGSAAVDAGGAPHDK